MADAQEETEELELPSVSSAQQISSAQQSGTEAQPSPSLTSTPSSLELKLFSSPEIPRARRSIGSVD